MMEYSVITIHKHYIIKVKVRLHTCTRSFLMDKYVEESLRDMEHTPENERAREQESERARERDVLKTSERKAAVRNGRDRIIGFRLILFYFFFFFFFGIVKHSIDEKVRKISCASIQLQWFRCHETKRKKTNSL